ncbi:serine/threonine-protein kinase ATR [Galdieria sulphuraria]|uniref:Serine/threonine-protein kinase TOR n=1 Tax=Galdieria sulphuraria TaxID=130081 RepID=M2Y939_GALSU|nr:serine/threonine-protein kinase ATR [Galdieria sulphuraria]EME32349.1 serine/threonine-protein kinase ATR [Galdieria sulphuraria]|eukprot:XP_005708869.1 serine/threonine-protein kinase ATR [Galdieria sulphuraria]
MLPVQDISGRWQSQVVSLLKQVYNSETRSARVEAARRFKETLEQKWRETVVPLGNSSKASSLHVNLAEELTTQLNNLVNSSDVRERIAAVVCLDVLMELRGESYREKIQRTHNGLRSVLQNVERCLPSAMAVEKLFASQPFIFEAQEEDVDMVSLESSTVSKHVADELELLRVSSKALGHLARTGGALAYRCVESEVSRAFERLSFRDHSDARFSLARLSAVFVLKEIAENAPAFFYGQRTSFVRLIWSALWDPKQQVRFYAALALRAFIQTVVRRDAAEMATLVGKLLQVSIDTLSPITKEEKSEFDTIEIRKLSSQEKPSTDIKTEKIHGSLLCLAELLRDEISRERLHGRFEEICEVVLYYQSTQDIFIRTEVVICLPLLASLDPTTFCHSTSDYLRRSHQVLVSFHKLYLENERLPAQHLVAYGQLAEAIGSEYISPFVNQVFCMIEDILPKKDVRKELQRNAKDVFSCIRMLAETLEFRTFSYTNHFHDLLDHMFAHGLSSAMVKALNSIGKKIPELLPQIQERLLDSVSLILSRGSPFGNEPASKANMRKKYSRTSAKDLVSMESGSLQEFNHSSILIERALETVANFDFRGRFLSSFVRENIFDYMNSSLPSWRRLAVSACCRLLAASSVYALEQQFLFRQQKLRRVYSNNLVKEIASLISRVLISSVADRDEQIRLAALEGLKDPRFSKYLAQPHLLNKLLVCLYDESLSVKRVAISLCGNLSFLNPALVFPVIRRRLAQLLITLRCEGKTFALRSSRDAAAVLLSIMVRDAPRIVWPYVVPILRVLIIRLRETLFGSNLSFVWDSGGEEAETVMYAAVGNVASNVGPNLEDLKRMLPELLNLLVGAVQDQTSEPKTKTAALNAFTLIVQNTSCVISPYNNFPSLLPSLLHAIRTETDSQVRQGVEQLLGTLGAIDPKEYKYGVSFDFNQTEHLWKESSPVGPSYIAERSIVYPGACEDYNSYAISPLEGGILGTTWEMPLSPKVSHSVAPRNYFGNENKDRLFSQRIINMALSSETLVSRLNHPYTANEEYFPSAALDALHRVISDSKLSHHHREAVNAITCIVQSLGPKCNEILPFTLSKLLWTLRPPGMGIMREMNSNLKTSSSMGDLRRGLGSRSGGKYGSCDSLESLSGIGISGSSVGSPPRGSLPYVTTSTLTSTNTASNDPNLREYVFKALAEVVHVARQHVRPYSWDIISICRYYWEREPLSSELRTIVILVERTCLALMDEFAVHLPTILPCIVATLYTDTSANRENALPVLHLLDVMGNHIEDYAFMLIPIVSKMACDGSASTSARLETLGILTKLITRVPIREVASQVIHSLLNALEQPDAKDVSLLITKIFGLIAERNTHVFSLFLDTIVHVLYSLSSPIDALLLQHLRKNRVDVSMFTEQGKVTSNLRQASLNRISSLSSLNRSGSSSSLTSLEGSTGPASSGGNLEKRRHHVNQRSLKNAWNLGRRTTAEDWEEWLNKFSNGLFRESGSPSIRSCARLAEVYTPLMQDLFNAAFLSCWTELAPNYQASLVETLLAALSSPSLPLDALQTLLSLAEFMEHDEKPLPIDVRRLATMAYRCGAYAKALRYKEAEYAQVTQPQTAKSAVAGEHGLISIYNNLLQQESAVGALKDAEYRFGIRRREEWFEKLQRWDEALIAYEKGSNAMSTNEEEKSSSEPERLLSFQKPVLSLQPQPSPDDAYEEPFAVLSEWDRKLGMIRCLNELGEWRRMESLCQELWQSVDTEKRYVLSYEGAASVAFNLDLWDEFEERVKYLQKNSFKWALYNALLAVHQKQYDEALEFVKHGRRILDGRLRARAAEGYSRAYLDIVNAERLVEIEESIKYLKNPTIAYRNQLASLWKARLQGIQSSYFYWYRILRVRCLVFHPFDSMEEWIKFTSLCRKSGRLPMSAESLRWLLSPNEALHSDDVDSWDLNEALKDAHPEIAFALLKHVYVAGRKMKAFSYLKQLAASHVSRQPKREEDEEDHLAARLYLKLAKWGKNLQDEMTPLRSRSQSVTEFFDSDNSSSDEAQVDIPEMSLHNISADSILQFAKKATEMNPNWYKTWHVWASLNAELVSSHGEVLSKRKKKHLLGTSSHFYRSDSFRDEPKELVIQAINGFFRTLSLCSETAIRLQDILRLLTLWFRYGGMTEVSASINAGIAAAEVDLWLDVIPQLFARLHSPNQAVRSTVRSLMVRIGRAHPQALVYPLHVAAKSTNKVRREAAEEILNALRLHSATLVEQAETVSKELVRVAILWHEMWHEGLEEASRLYFGEHNVEGMLEVLEPLHAMLELGPETAREAAFIKEFGRDLAEAAEWCRRFKASGKESDMNQAWDLYYHVFRRINKQLPSMTSLDLAHVSPKLLRASNLELAIPGTYSPSFESNQVSIVRIAGFSPTVQVINSKQRPRRLIVYGSDGREHAFLLKGHEDLRQDERVMQLFGLVNELLSQNASTNSKALMIKRFSVVPLSPNTGLIGWVPGCDTLHSLIREFREQRKILLNVEHRLMLQMAPDYDNLTLIQKVEVFEYALSNTTGADLSRVLWLKSRNSEMWLDKRTTYTRSLATMSMVGYVLGLGDRHPSNLMLERNTGRVIHIDFGDCFEVAMLREKFPEKIPFRLTRMLVNAMEVCGIEGYFRHTCESVMSVLRDNKDSLMAMLEAFVHDPLINWRLLGTAEDIIVGRHVGYSQESSGKGVNGLEKTKSGRSMKTFAFSMADNTSRARFIVEEEGDQGNAHLLSKNKHLLQGPYGFSLSDIARIQGEKVGTEEEEDSMWNTNSRRGFSLRPGETPVEIRHRDMERLQGSEAIENMNEAVNRRALAVIRRVHNKLTGKDFDDRQQVGWTVSSQVDRLIVEAMKVENLCQCYIGWCAFW